MSRKKYLENSDIVRHSHETKADGSWWKAFQLYRYVIPSGTHDPVAHPAKLQQLWGSNNFDYEWRDVPVEVDNDAFWNKNP